MDLVKEFKEYRYIYNTYFDALQSENKASEEKRAEIIKKDKEDIEMQHDSKEKREMLEQYMAIVFKIQLINVDMYKIAQRLLYINEAAIRKSIDLELSEEDKKFMQGLSNENQLTYIVDNNGKLAEKIKGIDEIIKKRVAERKDMTQAYMEEIRKSPEYAA